jgi:hypothetical protein
MSGNLVCEFLVLFFKMSISGWVSLTVSEGISRFTKLRSEPDLLDLSKINDEFAYPIRSLSFPEKFLGLNISEIYEYRIDGIDEGCVGVYIDFGNSGFSVVESDECLSIVEGIVNFSEGKISLHRK